MVYIINSGHRFHRSLIKISNWTSFGFVFIVLFSCVADAKKNDFAQAIEVHADKQQVEITKNRVTFFNNVVVSQGSIKLKANKLVVSGTGEKGTEVMVATGTPATFHQILESGKPIDAEANEIRYEIKTRTLTLTGNSKLSQEESVVKGHKVQYDIDRQEMIAEGSKGKKVTTIFLPQQFQEEKE